MNGLSFDVNKFKDTVEIKGVSEISDEVNKFAGIDIDLIKDSINSLKAQTGLDSVNLDALQSFTGATSDLGKLGNTHSLYFRM